MSRFKFFDSRQLAELHGRNRADAPNPITSEDLAEFLRNPHFWQKMMADQLALEGQALHKWMQGVYDDLFKGTHFIIEVPPPPVLTAKQRQSLQKYAFRLFFVPPIRQDEYPPSFIPPVWEHFLDTEKIDFHPLSGRWVAVEVIPKPDYLDPYHYPNDKLSEDLGIKTRFGISWDRVNSARSFLLKTALLTGFPRRSVRLPTAEEWCFLSNLFHWLNAHRDEKLPNLWNSKGWEWVENSYDVNDVSLIIGDCHRELSFTVNALKRFDTLGSVAFRVLCPL